MNVFEAYEKHVRNDMLPPAEVKEDEKLFELHDDPEREANDTKQEEKQADAVQFKLSDDDRESIVKALAELLKGGENDGD